jgi:hypothetical protein
VLEVLSVGEGLFMGLVLFSIRMLSRTNSCLPVQVFVPDGKDYDTYIGPTTKDDFTRRYPIHNTLEHGYYDCFHCGGPALES